VELAGAATTVTAVTPLVWVSLAPGVAAVVVWSMYDAYTGSWLAVTAPPRYTSKDFVIESKNIRLSSKKDSGHNLTVRQPAAPARVRVGADLAGKFRLDLRLRDIAIFLRIRWRVRARDMRLYITVGWFFIAKIGYQVRYVRFWVGMTGRDAGVGVAGIHICYIFICTTWYSTRASQGQFFTCARIIDVGMVLRGGYAGKVGMVDNRRGRR
jgi:hypothetical protein